MLLKITGILLILTAILLPPILLRPSAGNPTVSIPDDAERLVIITAHNESVKRAMEEGFKNYYRNKTGKEIVFDYRSPGGTSDIMRYLADRYETEFRRYYEERGEDWNPVVAGAFSNPRMDRNPKASKEEKEARGAFLASDVGIGIDLMAGGGVFDLSRNAERGFAVDAKIKEKYPHLFKPELIPESFGGEFIYDPKGRYYGLCLSTFGLCYNADRIKELADATPPKRWADLGQGRFFNKIVIADPIKSGSANKCFEVMIQQFMAETKSPSKGWADGLNNIKRIIANAAFITDSAGKVPRDVASGNAVAGMAIDTYGLTEQEWNTVQFKGCPHFFYVPPEGGTAVSPDPIQLLRGAPNKKAAQEFIAFMLSKEGQKLFAFKAGEPGGPGKDALRRPPVRKDLYDEKYRKFRSDPDYNPYESGSSFTYRPELTGRYYTLLRILIRCIMLDPQNELKDAWKAILDAGGPESVPEAMVYFNTLPFSYEEASGAVLKLRKSKENTAVDIARTTRLWRDEMRKNYLRAKEIAERKRMKNK